MPQNFSVRWTCSEAAAVCVEKEASPRWQHWRRSGSPMQDRYGDQFSNGWVRFGGWPRRVQITMITPARPKKQQQRKQVPSRAGTSPSFQANDAVVRRSIANQYTRAGWLADTCRSKPPPHSIKVCLDACDHTSARVCASTRLVPSRQAGPLKPRLAFPLLALLRILLFTRSQSSFAKRAQSVLLVSAPDQKL